MEPNTWVSIEDDLPEMEDNGLFTSREVLITDGKEIFCGYLQYDSLRDYYDEDEEEVPIWTLEGRDMYRLDGITHWMELPKLP